MKKTFGRYEIIRRLGAGGMAEVYLARAFGAEGFEKLIVIKTILPHVSHDPEMREMFIAEAKIAASLQHQNIVTVFDLGRLDDQLFIAMEYLDGPDLRQAFGTLELERPFPVAAALFIVSEALQGLHYAHTRMAEDRTLSPVIHRDVSLSNILLSKAGEVKVSDFGIAKAMERPRDTEMGVLRGKLRYMAPERLEGKDSDPRVDIYSVGLVLHTLLSGRHPLDGQPEPQMMDRIRGGDLPPPSAYNPDIPRALDLMVSQACARHPRERFESADAFREAVIEYGLDNRQRLEATALVSALAEVFGKEALEESAFETTSSHWRKLGRLEVDRNSEAETVIRTMSAPREELQELGKLYKPKPPPPKRRKDRDAEERKPPFQVESAGVWLGHSGPMPQPVTALAISGDGKQALSGSTDATARLWYVASGERAATLEGHTHRLSTVAFSPDGRLALTGSYDRTIKLWDLSSGKDVWTLEGHRGWVLDVRFSPDGTLAASSSWDRTLKIWDVMKGKAVATFTASDGVTSLAFASGGKTVLTGTVEGMLTLWDVATGIQLRTWEAHRGSVTSVEFITGTYEAMSSSDDRTLKWWEARTGKHCVTFDEHDSWVNDVAIDRRARFAVTAGEDRTMRVWSLADQACADSIGFTKTDGAVRSVAVSPDGETVLAGTERGVIRAFRVKGQG